MSNTQVKHFKRLGAWCLSLAAASALWACGDDSSNPEIITDESFRSPSGFEIRDLGDGKLELSWVVKNAPSDTDYDGFNIYGVRRSAADIGLDHGSTLQLLDAQGEPIETAKTALQKMNFNLESPFTPGDDNPVDEDGESLFVFFPIYSAVDEESKPLLPTCQPNGSGVCSPVTAAAEDLEDAVRESAFNSRISYTIDAGVKVGEEHCFLVLTSSDQGQGVSRASSEFACITPRYKSTASLTVGTLNDTCTLDSVTLPCNSMDIGIGLDFIDECKADSACAAATLSEGATKLAAIDSTGSAYFELFNGRLWFVAGSGVAINDLGIVRESFDNSTLYKNGVLPRLEAPILSTLMNKGGFSLPGESIPVLEDHMYLIAVQNEAGDGYYEHLLNVSQTPSSTAAFTVDLRIGVHVINY